MKGSNRKRIALSLAVAASLALALVAVGCGGGGGVKERVTVEVTQDGFVPKEIPAKAGQAITLVVTRKTDLTCAKQIVFADLGVQKDLPLNQAVEVTVT